eukprot:14358584-Ditylum_brightwellii.AAC.1
MLSTKHEKNVSLEKSKAQNAKKSTASLEKAKNASSIKEKDQDTPSQHGSTGTVVIRKGKNSTDLPLQMNDDYVQYAQKVPRKVSLEKTPRAGERKGIKSGAGEGKGIGGK